MPSCVMIKFAPREIACSITYCEAEKAVTIPCTSVSIYPGSSRSTVVLGMYSLGQMIHNLTHSHGHTRSLLMDNAYQLYHFISIISAILSSKIASSKGASCFTNGSIIYTELLKWSRFVLLLLARMS